MKITDLLNGTAINTDSGYDAPPYSIGILKKTMTMNGGQLFTFEKPSSVFSPEIIVTGPSVIPHGGNFNRGDIQLGQIVVVKYTGTATFRAGYGFKPNDWTAQIGYPKCLTCLGVVESIKPTSHNNTTQTNKQVDEKLMIARLFPVTSFWGKLQSSVSKGGSGTVLISKGNGAWSDSGMTCDNVVCVAQDGAVNDLLDVADMNGVWEGYPRACSS